MINIVIFGAPGSGKGTQSDLIKTQYALKHISTGEILRAEIKQQTELGVIAHEYIHKGQLVPDELVIRMLDDVITHSSHTNGFIFDGFPRTLNQGKELDVILAKHSMQVDSVISLEVKDEELIDRLIKRGKESGRSDDTIETIRERLNVYYRQTEPLKAFYDKQNKLNKIHGEGDIKTIFSSIADVINQSI